jgi:glycosyltransferase involved in cell wall biosynthesis
MNRHNIVIVAHKYLTQPDDELVVYLNNKKYSNVLHIMHSFSDAPDRCSYYRLYQSGKLVKEHKGKEYKNFPEPILYLKELLATIRYMYSTNISYDTYIGMDGLCVIFGRILKLFKKVKKVIFWTMDFVPENRFNDGWKNKIYHWINISGYKGADEMWDLSPRMLEAREKFLGIKKSDYKSHKVVPYGMWVDKVKTYSYDEIDPYTIVFMGHLLAKQGVQLILESLPDIVKLYPKIKFKIIGGGSYKDELEKIANDFGVMKYCHFLGKIDNIRDLEDEVANSTIAVAPYIKKLDTWTYYADPGKIKTYIACGVPVLLTDIPWNAKDIEENKCGIIIDETRENIINAIDFLLKKSNNIQYRNNAKQYAKNFNYENIFNGLNL